MSLTTQKDFETKVGQEKIVKTIHELEAKIRELHKLVHDCIRQESRLERDLEGLD